MLCHLPFVTISSRDSGIRQLVHYVVLHVDRVNTLHESLHGFWVCTIIGKRPHWGVSYLVDVASIYWAWNEVDGHLRVKGLLCLILFTIIISRTNYLRRVIRFESVKRVGADLKHIKVVLPRSQKMLLDLWIGKEVDLPIELDVVLTVLNKKILVEDSLNRSLVLPCLLDGQYDLHRGKEYQ